MSNQAPDGTLPNDAAQGGGPGSSFANYAGGKSAAFKKKTNPLAGRDPVQPHNRGNQQQN